jgi:hypothetical protein
VRCTARGPGTFFVEKIKFDHPERSRALPEPADDTEKVLTAERWRGCCRCLPPSGHSRPDRRQAGLKAVQRACRRYATLGMSFRACL